MKLQVLVFYYRAKKLWLFGNRFGEYYLSVSGHRKREETTAPLKAALSSVHNGCIAALTEGHTTFSTISFINEG